MPNVLEGIAPMYNITLHQGRWQCNFCHRQTCHMPSLHMQVYYHNPSTGESSWQKPEGFEGVAGSAGAAPIPISSDQIPNTGWAEVTCSDGRKYYYHAGKEVCACQRSRQTTINNVTAATNQTSTTTQPHQEATEWQTTIWQPYDFVTVSCMRYSIGQPILSACTQAARTCVRQISHNFAACNKHICLAYDVICCCFYRRHPGVSPQRWSLLWQAPSRYHCFCMCLGFSPMSVCTGLPHHQSCIQCHTSGLPAHIPWLFSCAPLLNYAL